MNRWQARCLLCEWREDTYTERLAAASYRQHYLTHHHEHP